MPPLNIKSIICQNCLFLSKCAKTMLKFKEHTELVDNKNINKYKQKLNTKNALKGLKVQIPPDTSFTISSFYRCQLMKSIKDSVMCGSRSMNMHEIYIVLRRDRVSDRREVFSSQNYVLSIVIVSYLKKIIVSLE